MLDLVTVREAFAKRLSAQAADAAGLDDALMHVCHMAYERGRLDELAAASHKACAAQADDALEDSRSITYGV